MILFLKTDIEVQKCNSNDLSKYTCNKLSLKISLNIRLIILDP